MLFPDFRTNVKLDSDKFLRELLWKADYERSNGNFMRRELKERMRLIQKRALLNVKFVASLLIARAD